MANHVDSHLYFHRISEEGKKRFGELVNRFDTFKEGYECHLAHMWYDDLEDAYSSDAFSMHDLVGAKWAYATDWDDDYISMYSAWSGCAPFIEYMIAEVAKVDPNVIAVYHYSDEMPNFTGTIVYNHEGADDAAELDYEDIRDMMMSDNEELKSHWDSEEEEFTEEGAELFHELVWDWVADWQSSQSNEMVTYLEGLEQVTELEVV